MPDRASAGANETRKKCKTLVSRTQVETLAAEIRRREFARLVILSDAVNRYVDVRLKEKVNWLKVNALIFLITRHGSLAASELADLMLRSNNSITWLVDNLEDDGLVRRRRTGKDRRAVTIQVTRLGLEFMRDNLTHIDLAQEEVLSSMETSELESLRSIIWKIMFGLSSGRSRPPEYSGDTSGMRLTENTDKK